MIERMEIRNYQSLGDVAIKLAAFTVIVGPSSSGKSAFARSMKTLTGNQRGDSFITHGESQCVIKATTDRGTVALLRGKKNEYVIIPNEGDQRSFTKLDGKTPEEVSAFIGIPSGDPLNYADQFDMPYMLKRSGGDVARELGALTNVSVIFEASREANRRRLQASSTLKTRAGDYEQLTSNLDAYRTLKEEQAAVARSEEALARITEAQTRISKLDELTSKLEAISIPESRSIPTSQNLDELNSRLTRLTALTSSLDSAYLAYITAEESLTELQAITASAEEDYTRILSEAGTCPTCGQDTHALHV